MDPFLVLAIAVGVLALVALAAAPLFSSWPARVRWTVRAQTLGQPGPAQGCCVPFDLREVVLTSLEMRDGRLELRVLESGRPAADTLTFASTDAPAPQLVSMLQEWSALRTPMLLYVHPAGAASLSGPVATVANLRNITTATLRPSR